MLCTGGFKEKLSHEQPSELRELVTSQHPQKFNPELEMTSLPIVGTVQENNLVVCEHRCRAAEQLKAQPI